jgi:protein SCO1/2
VLKAYMAASTRASSRCAARRADRGTRKEFKVFFAKVPGRTPDSYTMDHTAGSYVFDGNGKLRLFVRYGSGTDALAADLKTLIAAG